MSEIILPGLLLLIAFCLKLFIDKEVDAPQTIKAICELPVDIMFLAMSFGVGYTISKEKSHDGLIFLFWALFVTIIVIVIWKKSLILLSKQGKVKFLWILLLFINLLFSGYTILYSMDLVTKDKKDTQEELKNKTENNKIDSLKINENGNIK